MLKQTAVNTHEKYEKIKSLKELVDREKVHGMF